MKKIWKWLLFVLVILLAAGCVFLYRYINRIRYNDGYVNGNTAGNLYNEGYFCEKDGIVYFANPADNYCLYSMNPDGTNIKKLEDQSVSYINVDDQKMSKSLGNFFTVREIGEKYDLQVLRLFMLSAHYRSPLNFSAELMEASRNSLERIQNAVGNLNHLLANASAEELTEEEKELVSQLSSYEEKFDAAMDDDLNTADALAAIFELVRFANTHAGEESSKAFLSALKEKIVSLSDVLGLIAEKKEEMLDADIEALIEERQAARKARNFARADEIRNELLSKGIVLEDTREGVKWKRA